MRDNTNKPIACQKLMTGKWNKTGISQFQSNITAKVAALTPTMANNPKKNPRPPHLLLNLLPIFLIV
jgi:hypothetical protein